MTTIEPQTPANPAPPERRAPVCGLLSLAGPFVAFGLAFLGDRLSRIQYHGDQGMFPALAYVALPLFGGFLAGMIMAGMAAMRDERWSALRWIGLLLNGGPIVYGILVSI